MAFDRFLIAPFKTGMQSDLKPFLIMDDAFQYLQNAYVFRGRVRKRFGSLFMGINQFTTRLAISIGTVASNTIPGIATQLKIGQMFLVGSDVFTVYQLGAGVLTLSTNAGATATIDSTTNPNTIVFTGEPAGSTVYYFPANPVMGLTQYEAGSINNHPSYAFDTQFAYVFNGGSWSRSGTAVWHGTNLNYFWATNWQGTASTASSQPILWVTNFNFTLGGAQPSATDDPIWTFDGTTWTSHPGSSVANGIFFLPAFSGTPGVLGGGPFVQTALMVVLFKNRLLLLNTVENNNTGGAAVGTGTATQYKNRCRYSFNGSPLAVNAWYEKNQTDSSGNVGAGGGFIDAATEEGIVSAEFIKDRLIVYFERSTWEIAYTGNQVLPFVFQKINTELGSQSTFSTVPFDTQVLTIGNTGVHGCSGANTIRIDNKIPQEIFDEFETKNSAPSRVAGIRDYVSEMVYWAFVNTEAVNQNFPNQILVYNYQNGAWALNDDCFTAFGYFEQQSDLTWATATFPWFQATTTWNGNITQANQRQVIGGTPEGYVLRIAADSVSRNAPSMQITNMTIPSTNFGPQYIDLNVLNHNIAEGDYVAIENAVGIVVPANTIFEVYNVADANNITLYAPFITGAYLGGGTLARVSNIQIYTKQFNPYDKDDSNVYLARVDFAVERTPAGQITVDYYPSATEVSMITQGKATQTIMGTGVLETNAYNPLLYPLEVEQERLNHPVYFQSSGTCIQLVLYFTPPQISNMQIAWSDFELDAMTIYTMRSGRMQ